MSRWATNHEVAGSNPAGQVLETKLWSLPGLPFDLGEGRGMPVSRETRGRRFFHRISSDQNHKVAHPHRKWYRGWHQRFASKFARRDRPSLRQKRVTPHTLRHTTAMELLQAGVDRAMIALWLGHESVETTQIYLHANRRIKSAPLLVLSGPGCAVAASAALAMSSQPKDNLQGFGYIHCETIASLWLVEKRFYALPILPEPNSSRRNFLSNMQG